MPKTSKKSVPLRVYQYQRINIGDGGRCPKKAEVERIPVGSNMGALVLTPNEEFLYTATAASGTYHVSVVKTGSWKVVAKVDISERLH